MDRESVNWCPLAQILMQKGGKVLRQFLLLEILTTILTNYSRFWMTNVHNPAKINYLAIIWNNLNGILKKSPNPSEKVLNDMLESWTTTYDNQSTLMEQKNCFEQWKNDVEKEQETSISCGVNIILRSWLSTIEQEIQELNSLCKIISQLNDKFHYTLQKAQSGLLLEIEKNERFLSRCIHKLRSFNKPSSIEFRQLVQGCKQDLVIWRTNCFEVIQGFCIDCRNLVYAGLQEAQDIRQSYAMVKFLNRFQNEIDDCDLQLHVDIFCDKWDDDLHNVLNRYEMLIQESMSEEAILNLSQSLCTDLEQFASFKEKKIRDFFNCFDPHKLPRLSKIQYSKLKGISKSSDLNQFDLTHAVAVWKKGNFVHSPLQDRDEDPHDWDTSISADILRLRGYRNSIIDLIAQIKISSATFETLWKELTMLLCNIASRCGDKFNADISGEIDQLKDRPVEPQQELELKKEFLTWCTDDILAQLSAGSPTGRLCIDMLQSIQTALDNLSKSRKACTCCICKRDFSTDRDLAEHMKTHQAFTCCICKRDFSTDRDLAEHMRTHQALKCLSCKKNFSTSSHIEEHFTTPTAWVCLGCEEYFFARKDIQDHMRTHPAPLKCISCSQYFFTDDDLLTHMRTYHDQPDDSCTYI